MMAHPDSSAPPKQPRAADPAAAEQEQAFARTHGHLNLSRNLLKKASTKKRFDSGEWVMERAGLSCSETVPADVPVEQLSPKLGPEGGPLERRPSRLESMLPELDAEKENRERTDG
ncbi:unnamed protein product [Ostreobium quekettii]|uniref:Uncharacterized protein n=1 Tax=Ostreobium quekettii TaxID=121088 RepID=A0A8S1J9N6_9CHLO|nr:unnamed protein product [Ostreobium quekettii]|eukprot:evm.model.scf_3042.1 EVM.evm.TU.scf_3042.1   scf_3042:1579-3125(-)